MAKRHKTLRWQVDHARTSGGPKFSALWEALRYMAHCLKEGEAGMSIRRLKEDEQ